MSPAKGIPEKYEGVVFIVERFGITVAMCVFLAWLVLFKVEKMQDVVLASIAVSQDKIDTKVSRTIRNERAIMQKLGIPVIVDADGGR